MHAARQRSRALAVVTSLAVGVGLLTPPVAVAHTPATASVAAKNLKQSRTDLGRIAAPADQALRKRSDGPVVVRLAVDRGARVKVLRLNGVDITDRLDRRAGTARLKVSGPLRWGVNGLLAQFVKGDRQSVASSRFTYVRKGDGLVSVRLPSPVPRAAGEGRGNVLPAGPVRVQMRPSAQATVTAQLNGVPVTSRFRVRSDGVRIAQLGPSVGLRYGRNTLRVRAVTPKGWIQVRTVRVTVAADGPLADAGPDRRTDTRHPVQLDGRKSTPTPDGRRVTYRWRVVGAPARLASGPAPVALRKSRSARPVLVARNPGTYTVANTARSQGRASTDQVTVAVSPSALVQPVTMTLGGQPSGPGIAVGSSFYPGGSGPGMQLVVLERSTLAPQSNNTFQPGEMSSLNQYLLEVTTQADSGNYLFVLAALPGGPPVSSTADLTQLIEAVQWLGFNLPDPSDPDSAIDPDQPFSLVGIPNPSNDTQGTVWSVPAALDGVFTPDINDNWTFNAADFPSFSVDSSGITLGTQSWPSPSGVGFQVVVADPVSLSGTSQFYAFPSEVTQMGEALQEAVTADQLVAIASAGVLPQLDQATNPPTAAAMQQVTGALRALGGSPTVFMSLGPADIYSFVGPAPAGSYPAEGSTVTGASGAVTGLLARTPQGGAFSPMAADPTGNADFAANLAAIAMQPAQAWPFSSTTAQNAALTYISQELELGCDVTPCDVRTEYPNLDYQTQWTGLVGSLLDITYPCSGNGPCAKAAFTRQDFQAVRGQLAKEFPLVDDVWALVGNIQQPFNESQGSTTTSLQRAVDAVDTAVDPPSDTTATTVLSFVTDVMWAISLVDVEAFAVYATVAGVLAVGAATGEDLADLPSGSPYEAVAEAGPIFTNDIIDQLENTMLGVGLLGSFVVQDWGRLSAVGAQTAGPWSISESVMDSLTEGTIAGGTQNMYSALFPVAYDAYALTPAPDSGKSIEQCQPAWWNDALPWSKATGSFAYLNTIAAPVTGVQPDAGQEWYALWEADKNPISWKGPTGSPPPGSLTGPMYQAFSTQQPQNAGLYAPWFWGRTYLSAQSPTPKKLDCKYR
jgi:hypothetical protein